MEKRLVYYWAVIRQPNTNEGYASNQLGRLFTAKELTEIATGHTYLSETYVKDGCVLARVGVYAGDVFYHFGQRMVPDSTFFKRVHSDTAREWRRKWVRARYRQWTERLKMRASQLNTIQL